MRKNVLVLALLLCGWFSLSAQSHAGVSVYVPPVTGRGYRPEDNSFFYWQLVFELSDQKFNLKNTQNGADFSLIGALAPYTSDPQYGERQYLLRLTLMNNKTGEIKVEGELVYESPDDVSYEFSVLVTTMIYTIPEAAGPEAVIPEAAESDDWRDKWLYFGAAVFWTPRFYYMGSISNKSSYNYANFGVGFSAEFHFLDFVSFETGAELTFDRLNLEKVSTEYRNVLIEIPFLLKYVIKPNDRFMLEPYVGAQINMPFYDPDKYDYAAKPYPFSGLFGFQFGAKTGPGALFADARFAWDFGGSSVKETSSRDVNYKRFIIHLGLGYKYGLLPKKNYKK
jgi:hypothetical protein